MNNTADSNTNKTADATDAEYLSNTRSNNENQCNNKGREILFQNNDIALHIAHNECDEEDSNEESSCFESANRMYANA